MRVFSDFSAVYLLFSLWYFPAKGQIGGTQHYGKRVIEMGKWCQVGNNNNNVDDDYNYVRTATSYEPADFNP